MKNKFKKGLILGGLLAVATAIGFALTKEGQELTAELQNDLKSLAKHLKKNLHALEDVTKDNYNDLITTIVDEYAKNKELADDVKQKLVAALQAKWNEMEEEYLTEQNQDISKK